MNKKEKLVMYGCITIILPLVVFLLRETYIWANSIDFSKVPSWVGIVILAAMWFCFWAVVIFGHED